MNWLEYMAQLYDQLPPATEFARRPEFSVPASSREVDQAAYQLNITLPESLRSLLMKTNGVMEMMSVDGREWFDSIWLIWSAAEIVEQNEFYRHRSTEKTPQRDLSQLVFFAPAGTDGILFGFPVTSVGICDSRVIVWNSMTDKITDGADSLEDFLRNWLNGTLTV